MQKQHYWFLSLKIIYDYGFKVIESLSNFFFFRILLRFYVYQDFFSLNFLGSRIGIIFAPSPEDSDKAEMHFIINGEIHKMSDAIPYKEKALYAVIDVYGEFRKFKLISGD